MGGWGDALAAAGLFSAFCGVAIVVTEDNPKTVLAYSSASLMGMLAAALIIAWGAGDFGAVTGVSLAAAHHVLVKGALFLAIGVAAAARPRWWPVLLPAALLALGLGEHLRPQSGDRGIAVALSTDRNEDAGGPRLVSGRTGRRKRLGWQMRRWRKCGLLALLLLGGCASLAVPMNEPLRSAAGNSGYRLFDVNRRGGAESALVLVGLSGGGKRSAAFAFGVLRGMEDIHVRPEGRDSTLLDEIDLLSGVSGGSFPAAYYGLYGKKAFGSFPEAFLYRDVEAFIWGTLLLPWNWDWLFNPLVGTNDRMTQIYDRLMFHGATFADLYRRGRPQISINATDISFGTPFGFLPQTFDVICSDLSNVPIARAVAASNGFPVLFGPITLRNYRGPGCPLPPPVSPGAVERVDGDLRARAALDAVERYSNGERVKWIHLMDGGISDNLALRVVINDALVRLSEAERFTPALLPIRRILVISVNAATPPNPNWPRQRVVSGLAQIVSAATGAQIGAYNLETLITMQSTVDELVAELRRMRCARGPVVLGYRCGDVTGKVLSVDLSDYPDPQTRARLLAIRTGLTLPRGQMDALVAAGETMIRRDAAPIAAFLASSRPAAVVARR